MRKTLLILLFLLSFQQLHAAHIFGGEMIYEYMGPGAVANTKKYRITLKLFRDNLGGGAAMPTNVFIGIFDYGTKIHFPSTQTYYDVPKTNETVVPINVSPCITGQVTGSYSIGEYSFVIDLPDNAEGYICAYETCCRINGLQNVLHNGGNGGAGSTYVCRIPGTNQLHVLEHNSSPQFVTSLDVVCRDSPFTWNFSATDPDGDSLVYSFVPGYDKTTAQNAANVAPAAPSPLTPDYPLLTYINGFSGAQPLGALAAIHPQTGIISGTAPSLGLYVTAVLIREYRDGDLISEHRKDFILRVQDCEITAAVPMPNFVTCDGFNINFSHSSTGNVLSVFWDFGDPTTLADTAITDNPSWDFTNAGAGTYTVKFVINRGTGCADSTTRTIGVWPGFFPGFRSTGACYLNPFQFTDTSRTNYGFVNTWSWNFGDETTLADTSHLQHPQWTYATPGPKTVTLTVTNSMGCIDTYQTVVDALDKPVITLGFRDTLICVPDAVTLEAGGSGVFNWTPPVNIVNANTATPTVNPTTNTWYFVNLVDNGCQNRDSVLVRVVPNVSLSVRPDTTICLGDPVQLNAATDGLSFQWTPAGTLNDPTIVNPVATPTDPLTIYQLTANIGSCSATDDVIVRTVPYPVANAGPNQVICYNTSAQLNASHDGISFSWSPTSYLNNPNILNPISTPPRTTSYVLTVFDNAGCPKPGRDTIVVAVNPKVIAFAGHDTTVIVGQPMHLFATGGVSYVWTPTTGFITSNTIQNPVAVYGTNIDSVRYKVVVTDNIGCPDSAFVTVRVFKTNPSVFVPTAFTPNGDGRNDVVRPIAVGMRRIIYFSIYNRWGELVFTTTENKRGWDGRINGYLQSSNVFVWMVSAEDYLGKHYFQKGTVTLIR